MGRVRPSLARVVAALAAALLAVPAVECRSTRSLLYAGFWFDRVSFALPARETALIAGPIREEEKTRIQATAWSELRAAYSGLRISLSEDRRAFYRVAVVQDLPDVPRGARSTIHGAAGQSIALVPFGGQGAVSFVILATNAIYYAPAGADRATIIDGIGRGIGRAAAHEFAHQILANVNIEAARDRTSYEYGSADRAEQYYGALHWDGAWEPLTRNVGTRRVAGAVQ